MSRVHPVKSSLLFAIAGALCAAASCSEDGVTTNCPALPLYQTFPLGDASLPDAMSGDSGPAQESLAAAIAAGCATGPNGVGSRAHRGGSGGAGESGSNSAHSAGASGSN